MRLQMASLKEHLATAEVMRDEARAQRDEMQRRVDELRQDLEAGRQDKTAALVRAAEAEDTAKGLREALEEAHKPFWQRWIRQS